MNQSKKQIIAARKGKKRVAIDSYSGNVRLQGLLKPNEYCLFLRVDAEEVNYIDKEKIIIGDMTEKVFDTIDSAKHTRQL